jgi:hypothetical protein
MKNKSLLYVVIATIVAFFTIQPTHATHLAGADLTYTCLGGNQYQIELTWYRDCAGVTLANTEVINVRSASRGYNQNFNATRVNGTNGQEITVPCNTQQTRCQSSTSTVPGIQKHIYRVTVTLPGASPDWIFSVRRQARNLAITNIDHTTNSIGTVYNPPNSGPSIYVEATLNNVAAPCNSSPTFSNEPVLFLCANQLFRFNQGSLDPNVDSLSYSLVPPLDNFNALVLYINPFTYLNPFTANPQLNIDPVTGDITVRPTQQEISVFAVRIDEWRNGVKIGSVMRDLQVYIQACNNALPTASGINGTTSFSTTACAGSQRCFTINSIDSDAGQTVTMTWNSGISGATFTTSTGARPVGTFCWTPTQADISPNPYTFTVTVRDNACPTNGVQIFSYSILVSGLSVELGPPVNLCATSYTITPTITNGNPPFTYLWSNNATTPTLTVTNSGTFAVTITDNTGCTGSDNVQVTLTQFGNQTVLPVHDTSICNNTPITITALPGFSSYVWSNGSTTASTTFTTSGTFSITATNQVGCQFVDNVNISIFNFVAPNLGPNRTTCANQLITLNPGQYLSYLWSNGATTPTITPVASGNYAVTVTDANGCTGTDDVVMTINPVPNANLGPDRVVCSLPVILAIRSSAQQTVQWSTGATGNILSVSTSGTYSVTVTNQFGCVARDTVVITISNTGISDLISPRDTSICGGSSLTLQAFSGFVTYVWSTGETTQSIAIDNSGTYTIQALDVYGCQNFDTIDVNLFQNPVVDLGADQTVCDGASASFDAGNGFIQYSWNTGYNSMVLQTILAGSYSVTVTDVNGCTATDEALLFVNDNPEPDLGPDVSICSNGQILLFLIDPYREYEWSTGETTENITVSSSGNYSVTVTDLNGCSGSDDINVSLYSNPDPGLPATVSICFGGSATLNAASGFSSYEWSTGETTESISVSAAGTYSVTVTDQNGCVGEGETVVSAGSEITLELAAAGNCENSAGDVSLTISGGTPDYTYSWEGPGGATYNSEDLSGVPTGNYSVTVTDDNGCSATGTVTLVLTPIVVDAGPDSVFICQGGSVQLEASGGTNYIWSPSDGLDNPNIANPVASPTVTTTYTVTGTQPGNELIFNGNFELGNTGFSSNYIYTTTNLFPERTYAVVTNPNPLHPAFQGSDHTSGSGYFMAVNGAVTPGQFVWCQTVPVQPNTDYMFSTWISTLVAQSPATLAFSINGQLLGAPINAPANLFQWDQFFTMWNSGVNTSADICIVNQNTVASGNDFGLDDISFVPVCTATDDITVVVNENPTPALGDDETICLGTSKTLSAGTYDAYEWSNGATTATITVNAAGTYSVTVTDANGCTGTDEIEIFTEACCFPAEFGNLFTTIDNTNNIISQNTVWAGKYFVTTDVFVQNGATLDLTNVDVVFDEGKGMIFLDDSRARANNSVFRTCDFDVSWAGFDFLDASTGLFNECVIKNAEVAMNVRTSTHFQIRNNEFYNFKDGIVFDNAGSGNYEGSVTGNKFISNEDRPDYFDGQGNLITDFFCIKSYSTVFEGLISQNQFIKGEQNRNSGTRLYGVYLNASAVSATENRFTNLYRAFDITGNGGTITLENNTIENTVRSYEDVYAIRITDAVSSPLLVEGNKITYASIANSNTNQAGIYLADSRGAIFSKNDISGFNSGISILRGEIITIEANYVSNAASNLTVVAYSKMVKLTRNRLTKTFGTGILLLDNDNNITVADNFIDAEDVDNASGIRLVDNDNVFDNATFSITGNCIHNTANAMTFESNSGAALVLPLVRNNYMYNYKFHGIWSSGFTGEIGSCNGYPANVGKNSFISNYLAPFGSAVDVRSDNATIFLSGNGPNLVITFPSVLVNTSCNTTATASCGNQIGNNEWGGRYAGPLTQIEKFRLMIEENYPLTLNGDNYMLNSDFMGKLNNTAAGERYKTAKAVLDILRENENAAEMERFFDAVSSSNLLSSNEARWLSYHYFTYTKDYQSAKNNLLAIVPQGSDERDLMVIEKIANDLAMTHRNVQQLTLSEKMQLSMIDDSERFYASVARDLIQASMGHHDYRFEQIGVARLAGSTAENIISIDDNFIRVYPNPASGQVTIGYLTNEDAKDVTIRMTNTLGQIMWEMPVEFNNGEVSLDVSGFANGAYFIYMFNRKDVVRHTKFVKF